MISLLGYLKRTDVVGDAGRAEKSSKNEDGVVKPVQQWEWKGLWSFDALTEEDLKENKEKNGGEGSGSSGGGAGSNRNGKQIRSNSIKYNYPRPFCYKLDKVQDASTVNIPSKSNENVPTNDAGTTEEKGDDASKENKAMDSDSNTPAPETFGSNGYTDAGLTESSGCPLGGSWNGYFENVSKRKDRNSARVSENFSLFFNATPEPNVSVTFQVEVDVDTNTTDDAGGTPLPENHVHVRGMGSNQFGTFELKGSFNPSNSILHCYRMYIVVHPPPSSLKRKSSITDENFNSGRTPTRVITRVRSRSMRFDDMEDPNNVSLINASSSSKKHNTRKKRMSWQKKESNDSDSEEKQTGNNASSTTPGSEPPSTSKVRSASNGESGGSSGKSKPSRKRSRSQSLPTESSSSSTSQPVKSTKVSASSNSSKRAKQTSPLTLPKAGLEKDARWRAAHYFNYKPATDDEPPSFVIYEGELLNQQRHGTGVCLFPNNTIYEGSFKKNREHGRGTLMSGDRSVVIYHGDWERGRMHGRGTLLEEGGAVYTGDFKENTKHGVGRYSCPKNNMVYDGEWRENVPSGRGMFTWPDGSTFVGHWKDGKRHGQGMLKVSDGFEYDGMWNNNAMEGRGIAVYPNGQRYEGLWSKGKKEGRGTVRFTNGAIYEGRFKEDRMEGQGTMMMVKNVVIENKNKDENESEKDWMIPIQFQSDMRHIHQRAGFTQVGE